MYMYILTICGMRKRHEKRPRPDESPALSCLVARLVRSASAQTTFFVDSQIRACTSCSHFARVVMTTAASFIPDQVAREEKRHVNAGNLHSVSHQWQVRKRNDHYGRSKHLRIPHYQDFTYYDPLRLTFRGTPFTLREIATDAFGPASKCKET